ncbi:hypothetical protein [Clostridioides sp. ES-S-0108-01]|uniref:hypothetical protein n=1 Tax=Clostridioides sp. ES-S-0108-01 TaxID=2770773 RepID=UPI001D0C15C4
MSDLNKKFLIEYIDGIQEELRDISDKIWKNPELQYKEYYASSLQKEYLKKHDFSIDELDGVEKC